jgi:hypothetical protein
MSLTAAHLLERLRLAVRRAGTLLRMPGRRPPDDAADLADLERIWQGECEAMPRGGRDRDRDQSGNRDAPKSRGGRA